MKRRAFVIGAAGWIAAPASADSAATLRAVNALRRGRRALVWSPVLETVAQAHADDMARRGFFSHTGSDGSDIGTRLRRAGYGFCTAAENIAIGQRNVAEVMESWRKSRGHRSNIQNRDMREVAVARAAGNVWVMVLGRSGC